MSKNQRLIILSFLILCLRGNGIWKEGDQAVLWRKKLIDLSAAIKSEPVGPEGNDDVPQKE